MKIGVLIYTYNRTDDARINMEIIRNLWNKSELLKNVTIVHSYNGEESWWPEKYLEDELIRLPNAAHFAGAEMLLNEGMKCFSEKHPDIDYVVLLASDTWLIKPEYLEGVIHRMKSEEKYLATCAWGTKKENSMWKIGMAMDFAVFDMKWSSKVQLFPLGYKEFFERYSEIFWYRGENIFPERVLALRFKQAIFNINKLPSEYLLTKVASAYVLHLTEREPIHDFTGFFKKVQFREMYWKELGLLCHHDPKPKSEILKPLSSELGQYGKKLTTSKDLSYYNQGIKKTVFVRGNKKIDYGD